MIASGGGAAAAIRGVYFYDRFVQINTQLHHTAGRDRERRREHVPERLLRVCLDVLSGAARVHEDVGAVNTDVESFFHPRRRQQIDPNRRPCPCPSASTAQARNVELDVKLGAAKRSAERHARTARQRGVTDHRWRNTLWAQPDELAWRPDVHRCTIRRQRYFTGERREEPRTVCDGGACT